MIAHLNLASYVRTTVHAALALLLPRPILHGYKVEFVPERHFPNPLRGFVLPSSPSSSSLSLSLVSASPSCVLAVARSGHPLSFNLTSTQSFI